MRLAALRQQLSRSLAFTGILGLSASAVFYAVLAYQSATNTLSESATRSDLLSSRLAVQNVNVAADDGFTNKEGDDAAKLLISVATAQHAATVVQNLIREIARKNDIEITSIQIDYDDFEIFPYTLNVKSTLFAKGIESRIANFLQEYSIAAPTTEFVNLNFQRMNPRSINYNREIQISFESQTLVNVSGSGP